MPSREQVLLAGVGLRQGRVLYKNYHYYNIIFFKKTNFFKSQGASINNYDWKDNEQMICSFFTKKLANTKLKYNNKKEK